MGKEGVGLTMSPLYHDKTKNQVYVAGGVNLSDNTTSKKVLKYDVQSNKWTDLPDMIEARKQPTLYVSDGCLVGLLSVILEVRVWPEPRLRG